MAESLGKRDMNGLLERIVASKRAEIELLHRRGAPAVSARQTRDVELALRRPGLLRLIAEVKFRSPSAGALSRALSAGERAVTYARAGVAMVSVLCDEPFFGGSYDDLSQARAALDAAGLAAALLAKEFVLDEVQLARAREAGADAALIIVRILDGGKLASLVEACRAHALEPFVEVASESELDRALEVGAKIIGVNVRDLDTLTMDADTARRILEKVPADRVAVHLSGLRTEDDIARCAKGRSDAALVGEALMRLDDPSELLERMLARSRK
jgi:indole-3-glycerol phosphate synthase